PVLSKYRWVSCNIVAVINDTDVLIVDSGLLPEAAREAILELKKITALPVRYLVNTHWHGDHWQGNRAFQEAYPGIEIISTEQGLKGMSRNGMVWATQLYNRYFQNYITDFEKIQATKTRDGRAVNESELKEIEVGLRELRSDLQSMKFLKPLLPWVTFSDRMVLTR